MRKAEQANTPNIHITEISRTEEKGMAGTGTINGQPCTITTIENVSDRSRINITMHSADEQTPPKIIEGQEALDLLQNAQPTYDEAIKPRETERFTRAVERNKNYEQRRLARDARKAEQARRLEARRTEQAQQRKKRDDEYNKKTQERIAELLQNQR
jgi:hypothetical protein